MTDNEKKLFFELCKFKKPNKNEICRLIKENATPAVLGELFFNRMQGIAYGVLEKTESLGYATREFRNSLKNSHRYNAMINTNYFNCINMVSNILEPHKDKYAMLKGALLCKAYPEGYRTSNDIDLLVRPNDVSIIGTALSKAGFKQGHIRNGNFIPATRREIIESKMMRGETVPYILEVNLPFMRFLEVDINFSLDYKNGEVDVINKMLDKAIEYKSNNVSFTTLNEYDFFIHLCCHLHKEAMTLPWITMKRDMTLYKYADIYLLLSEFEQRKADIFLARATELGLLDICCCVINWVVELFDIENLYIHKLAKARLNYDDSALYEVDSPSEKKKYKYVKRDIKERFFSQNRIELLEEVKSNEKT